MQKQFFIRKIFPDSVDKALEDIGFFKGYIKKAKNKYNFLLVKIHGLNCAQANTIKQLALSLGADAAVHMGVISSEVETTDLIIGATYAQLIKLVDKLNLQPFGLKKLSQELHEYLLLGLKPLKIRNTELDWAKKTYIMGILNVTPDSFSDGRQFDNIDTALDQVNKMLEFNVDIIDIGGESTRPYSKEVSPDEELHRVIPVIKEIRKLNENIPISIDTRHSIVAKEAVLNGADIINDVSGFDWDDKMLYVALELQVPVVIMHSLSSPETMQINPEYSQNVVDCICTYLHDKTQKLINAGIKKENIIVDPGVGFGKTLEHNIEIIKRIQEFASLGFPLLAGISRKSIISNIIDLPITDREDANIALNSYAAANGANIIRVHDVEKHYKAFAVLDRIIK